jgi:lysophospholipase L1-like esterase/ribosome recycling factor
MEEIVGQPLLASLALNPGFIDPVTLASGYTSLLAPETLSLENVQPIASPAIVPSLASGQSAMTTSAPAATSLAADPLLGGPLIVNDSDLTANLELHKAQYGGRWNVSSDASAYQQDNHWTDDIGATYQVKFDGSQIKLFGTKTPWHGIAGISIDGGPEILVDTFSTNVESNVVLFQSSVLTDSQHTIQVRVTGQKNSQSNNINLQLDKLEVYGANVQPTVPPVNTATRIIDDQDLGNGVNRVQYTGVWNLGQGNDNYGGSSHWTSNSGATYQTQFYGSQVKLFGAKAPWHGVAAISIDGGTEMLIDTYGTSLQQTLLFANTGLQEGLHTLRVRVTGAKNVNAVDSNLLLDRLEVTTTLASIASPAPSMTATQIVDDHDLGTGLNQVQYTGNWNPGFSTEAFNGNSFWTKETGATYTAKFSGTQIKLFGAKAPWHGIAAISIDGGPETSIDTYGTGFYNNSLLYANNTLTQGEHTIRVRVTGQRSSSATDNYLLLDRLEVVNTNSNTVDPNSSVLNFSPYNWLPVGQEVQTSDAGAYIKFDFNGSQAILNVDTNSQTSFPLIDVFVDGQLTSEKLWLKNAVNGQLQIFSGAAGNHQAVVYFRQREFFDRGNPAVLAVKQNDWSTDAEHLRVSGVLVNGGSGFLPNTSVQPKRAVFFGDSITEGGLQSYEPGPDRPADFYDVNIPQSPAYNTYAAKLGELLGVDYGQIGWSGSGWIRPFTDTGVPPFPQTWLQYNGLSTVPRSFNPPPDYVFVNLGTNDFPFNPSENGINFNVTSTAYDWLVAARQQIPGAEIFAIAPFNQSKTAQLQAAFNQYLAAFPTDSKVHFLDLGAAGAVGLQFQPSAQSLDGIHPTAARHQELANLLFAQIPVTQRLSKV